MNKKFLIRVLCYIVGLFSIAIGVAFSVNSNLGISPVTSIPYVLSLVSNLKLSIAVIVVYMIFIVVQFFVNPKDFRLINLTEILFAILFGYFTDFTSELLGTFTFGFGYAGQVLMLLIANFFIALGVCIYLNSKLVPMPMEGMQMAIVARLKKDFGKTKMAVDVTVVVIAVIISIVFAGNVMGIREGTIISAVLVGKIVSLMQKKIKPFMEKICF